MAMRMRTSVAKREAEGRHYYYARDTRLWQRLVEKSKKNASPEQSGDDSSHSLGERVLAAARPTMKRRGH
jgi:hypothetical protein